MTSPSWQSVCPRDRVVVAFKHSSLTVVLLQVFLLVQLDIFNLLQHGSGLWDEEEESGRQPVLLSLATCRGSDLRAGQEQGSREMQVEACALTRASGKLRVPRFHPPRGPKIAAGMLWG